MNLQQLSEEAATLQADYKKFDQEKGLHSWGPEELYSSLVSDVGDLGRLVLAEEGFRAIPDLEQKLSHELAEILWATLILARTYNIDLTKAFLEELQFRKESLTNEASGD